MTSLEERVLDAIEASGMSVPELAKKVGVTVQSIYAWKQGASVTNIKARFLVEIADAAGYEALWIMKGRGAIGPYKASPLEKEAADEIERLRESIKEISALALVAADLCDSEYGTLAEIGYLREAIKNAPKGVS